MVSCLQGICSKWTFLLLLSVSNGRLCLHGFVDLLCYLLLVLSGVTSEDVTFFLLPILRLVYLQVLWPKIFILTWHIAISSCRKLNCPGRYIPVDPSLTQRIVQLKLSVFIVQWKFHSSQELRFVMGTSPRANKYEMILIVIFNIVLAVASYYWWETLQ